MPDPDADRSRPRSSLLLTGAGGLLGMAGVALAAAASHEAGGPLATTAGQFCIMHGGTAIALAAIDRSEARRLFAWAGAVLVIGTGLFAGDLAAIGFGGWRPLPMAAPAGGLMMIGGWGLAVVAAGEAILRRR